MTRKIKIIIYTIITVILIGLLIATITLGSMNKSLKQELKYKTEQVDSLSRYNKELGELNGLQVNVTFQFTQKNVLSFSQSNCQNVAKEIAQMTRKELLDSLQKKDVSVSK